MEAAVEPRRALSHQQLLHLLWPRVTHCQEPSLHFSSPPFFLESLASGNVAHGRLDLRRDAVWGSWRGGGLLFPHVYTLLLPMASQLQGPLPPSSTHSFLLACNMKNRWKYCKHDLFPNPNWILSLQSSKFCSLLMLFKDVLYFFPQMLNSVHLFSVFLRKRGEAGKQNEKKNVFLPKTCHLSRLLSSSRTASSCRTYILYP